MTIDSSAGRLYVDVVADTSNFADSLRRGLRQQIKDEQAKVRVRLDVDREQARAEIQAAVREAAAGAQGRAVVKVGVDRDHLRRNIAGAVADASQRVQDRARVRVGVDLDTKTFDAEVAAAKAAAGWSVETEVQAETGEFVAETEAAKAAARRPVKVPVDADTSPLLRRVTTFLGQLSRIALGSGLIVGIASALEGVGAAIGAVVGGLGAVVGGLYAVIAAATPAVAVLALVGNAVAAIGAVALTAFAGFSGLSDAFSAYASSQEQAAQATAAAGDAARASARQIESAARSVEQAERSVARAQENARLAQERLNDARDDARERLEDYQLALRSAALDEESAALGLARAKQNLAEVQSNPFASELDIREAELQYQQALLRQDEVRESNDDLAREVGEAQARGIEGDEQVVAAKRDVRDAIQAVTDAQENLRLSQQALADAQRQANETVAAASAANQKLADTYGKLTPAAQAFVRFLYTKFRPALLQIRDAVQEALLPDLQAGLERLLPTFLPFVQRALVETAGVIGAFWTDLVDFLVTPSRQADFQIISDGSIRALERFGNAIINVLNVVTDVATVLAQPGGLLDQFSTWVESLTEGWEQASANARATGEMAEFFQRAWDVLMQLGRIFGNIIEGLVNIGQAGSDTGQSILDTFEQATARFVTWTEENEAKIREWFAAVEPFLTILGEIILQVVQAFGDLADDPQTLAFWEDFRDTVVPALERLLAALLEGGAGSKLLDAIVAALDALAALAESGSLGAFLDAMTGIFDAITDFVEDNPDVAKTILGISGALGALALVASPVLLIASAVGKLAGAFGLLKSALGIGAKGGAGAAAGGLLGGLSTLLGLFGIGYAGINASVDMPRPENDEVGRRELYWFTQAPRTIGRLLFPWMTTPEEEEAARQRSASDLSGAVGATPGLPSYITDSMLPQVGRPGQNGLMSIGQTMGADLVAGLIKGVSDALREFGWRGLVDTFVIQPFKQMLGIASPSTLFAGFGGDVVAGFFGGVSRAISAAIGTVQGVFQPVVDALLAPFSAVGTFFTTTLPGWIAQGAAVLQGLPGMVTGWLAGLPAAVSGIVASVGAAFGRLWSSVANAMLVPVNWIGQTLWNNGLRALWQRFDAAVGGGLPDMPAFTPLSGPAQRGPIDSPTLGPARALGGVEPGYAPGQDTRLALVSPGEGFLVPETVVALARMMGLSPEGAIDAINSFFSRRVRGQSDKFGSLLAAPPQQFMLGGVGSGGGGGATPTPPPSGSTVTSGVYAILNGARSWLAERVQSLMSSVTTSVGNVANQMTRGLSDASSRAFQAIGTLRSGLRGIIETLANSIGNSMPAQMARGLITTAVNWFSSIIPGLAQGATVLPTPGGTLVRVAEAGRAETVVDTGAMNVLLEEMAEYLREQARLYQESRDRDDTLLDGLRDAVREARGPDAREFALALARELSGQDLGAKVIVEEGAFQQTVHNPVPEQASVSLSRQMRQAAEFGLASMATRRS